MRIARGVGAIFPFFNNLATLSPNGLGSGAGNPRPLLISQSINIFIVFPLMGRTYDAAVISAGFGGISLGSTPTAMANMAAVTQRYGPSHLAFIVVPLVCAFFIDLVNALAIPFFLGLGR